MPCPYNFAARTDHFVPPRRALKLLTRRLPLPRLSARRRVKSALRILRIEDNGRCSNFSTRFGQFEEFRPSSKQVGFTSAGRPSGTSRTSATSARSASRDTLVRYLSTGYEVTTLNITDVEDRIIKFSRSAASRLTTKGANRGALEDFDALGCSAPTSSRAPRATSRRWSRSSIGSNHGHATEPGRNYYRISSFPNRQALDDHLAGTSSRSAAWKRTSTEGGRARLRALERREPDDEPPGPKSAAGVRAGTSSARRCR